MEFSEVVKVLPQGKVRQSGLRSRSLTLHFVVVGGSSSGSSPECFFRTSPQIQKSALAATRPSARVHGHSSSSELSARQIPRAGDPRDTLDFFENEAGMWMRLRPGRLSGRAWLRSTWSATWGGCWSSRWWRVWCSFWSTLFHGGFWMYWSSLSALVALRTLVHYSPFSSLFLAVIACSFGCCLWSTVIGFSGDPGATRAQCLVRQWLHVLRQSWRFWTNYAHFLRRRGLGFRPFSRRMEKYSQSMLQFESLR